MNDELILNALKELVISLNEISQKNEESTNRIVDALDRVTAAIIALNNDSFSSRHLNNYLDAYKFLQNTKGDAE